MRLLLLFLIAAPALAQPADDRSDIGQIEDVIGLYFQGHATGDGSYFEQAFHPDALMFSSGDGEVRVTRLSTWWTGPDGRPADDEADRRRRIVSIDVSGTAAAARLELDYPDALIHDYMTLVKASGRWQIVNKVFVVHSQGGLRRSGGGD